MATKGVYSDNLDQVKKSLRQAVPSRTHELKEFNSMEYAAALHAKQGYYVFNPQHLLRAVRRQLVATAKLRGHLDDRGMKLALEAAAYEDLNFLTSVTGEKAPPVGARRVERAGGEATYVPPKGRAAGYRFRHPGYWADDSGNLVQAYDFEVT